MNKIISVSIIIPVFNGEKYLKQAIDSALAQTYKNCEVFVVDDGSTDGSEQIAKSYGNRIRYFKQKNGGVSSALNFGIKQAKGEYISWLSHDDIYSPQKIETQLQIANENTICFSNYKIINNDSKVIETPAIELAHNIKKFKNHLYPVVKGLIFGCTLLIPKKCFSQQGVFDETLKTSQDYDMWLRLFPKYNIAFQPDYLMYSRKHAGQGTYSKQAETESNTFWIKLMKDISDADKTAIDGSVENFYYNLSKQLKRVGYYQASSYAKKFSKPNFVREVLQTPLFTKIRRVLRKY